MQVLLTTQKEENSIYSHSPITGQRSEPYFPNPSKGCANIDSGILNGSFTCINNLVIVVVDI